MGNTLRPLPIEANYGVAPSDWGRHLRDAGAARMRDMATSRPHSLLARQATAARPLRARHRPPRTLSGACTGRRSVSGAAFLFSRQRGRVRRHRRKAQGQGHPVAEHKHGKVDMQVNTQHGGHIVYWNEPDGHAGARSPWVMRETARATLQIGTGSTLASREMNHSPRAWPAHSRPSPA